MFVRLPFPEPELMPNRKNGRHWAASHGAKVRARDSAFLLALDAARKQGYTPPETGDIAVSLVFAAPDKRKRDADNLLAASKSMLDGVAMALKVDDKRFRPILIDWVDGAKPGATLLAVGVQITTSRSIEV